MKGQKEEEQVLKVSNNGGRGRGRGAPYGRDGGRGRGRGGRGKFNKENVECYKCHKLGHFQSECPDWEEDNVNYAEFDEAEELLLMAQKGKEIKEIQRSDERFNDNHQIWFLDSGCSNHMVGNKEWLFDYDDSFKDSVKLGDDSKMAVIGKGNL
ncbi:retrovirus-related Pol polyprotein from transposon TNT 1-94, partial [Trifolium pratense]